MHRKTPRPFGQSVDGIRIISMLVAMVVLWMLFGPLKDGAPRWIVVEDQAMAESPPPATSKTDEPEQLVPGPNDLDPDELAAIQGEFEAVADRAALKPGEMDVYWRLMDWSRTQPFSEMEKRAKDEVPFKELLAQPELYRGKLIRLRMHVRRVLEYQAPKNASDISKVYESWGWTDDSRTFPCVVAFPHAPAGLPVGTDVRAEIVFVGYFLKVITNRAFNNLHEAPLLVGRAKLVSQPAVMKPSKPNPLTIPLVLIGGTGFIGYSIWSSLRSYRKSSLKMLPNELSVMCASDVEDLQKPFPHRVQRFRRGLLIMQRCKKFHRSK